MVNGLPGMMATCVARHICKDTRFQLFPYSFKGENKNRYINIEGNQIELISKNEKNTFMTMVKEKKISFITVDFTLPTAVNDNAEFYCLHNLPFVMGTTGGNRQEIIETVLKHSTLAVISQNMAKEIVAFQSMFELAANNFNKIFDKYSLTIRESHQKNKVDVSATAKEMLTLFKSMGVNCSENDIISIRDPETQKNILNIPKDFISGHAWFFYELLSEDSSTKFEFSHKINGRDIYAKGTLDAIIYLDSILKTGGYNKTLHTMQDVLKYHPANNNFSQS